MPAGPAASIVDHEPIRLPGLSKSSECRRLHPIDSGSILCQGREISRMGVQQIARLGMLRTFQQTRIFSKMDCIQNLLISLPHSDSGHKNMFGRFPRAEIPESDLIALAGNEPFLSIRNLRAGYGNMEILHDLTLHAGRAQSLCMIGPNGAGKSTILHSICGFTRVFGGEITVGRGADKRDITTSAPCAS